MERAGPRSPQRGPPRLDRSPEAKASTYRLGHAPPPFSMGYKLLYRQDTPMPTPGMVLGLDPPPDLVTYQ